MVEIPLPKITLIPELDFIHFVMVICILLIIAWIIHECLKLRRERNIKE